MSVLHLRASMEQLVRMAWDTFLVSVLRDIKIIAVHPVRYIIYKVFIISDLFSDSNMKET